VSLRDDNPDAWESQRATSQLAAQQALQAVVRELIRQHYEPSAIAAGITDTALMSVGVLNGNDEAATYCTAAALSYVHELHGRCSPEVAGQALRDRLPDLITRIEASQ
jgi:hypothetical protein